MSDLWNEDAYAHLLLTRTFSTTQKERIQEVRKCLNHKVSIAEMDHHTPKDAIEVFTRLNTKGKRLSQAEIKSAAVASTHHGFIRDYVVPLTDSLRSEGFEHVTMNHLFKACAAIAAPAGQDARQLPALKSQEIHAAWKQVETGLKLAKDLLDSEFGVRDMRLMRSGSLLIVPMVVLGTSKAKTRPTAELAGWLAMASLFHRYSGSSETAIDQDLKACQSQDRIGALLKLLRAHNKGSLTATSLDFRGALADRGALFAAYVGCRQTGAVDPFNGGALSHTKSIEHHHIIPRATFPAGETRDADVIANMAFISASSNASIGKSHASE